MLTREAKDIAIKAQAPLDQHGQVTVVESNDSLLAVIANAARDPSCDVNKMRALLDMKRELERDEAVRSFNSDMVAVQGQIRHIVADASNPSTSSKYASYLALDKALRPIYTAHGFSLSFDTADPPRDNYVRVIAYVGHRDGHIRTYHADMPADGLGAKGSQVMTKTHATGSAMSYGMRYLLKMIFNVAVGEDDDDGNKAGTKFITSEQAIELETLIKDSGGDVEKFKAHFQIDSLIDVPANKFERAKAVINEAAAARRKSKP